MTKCRIHVVVNRRLRRAEHIARILVGYCAWRCDIMLIDLPWLFDGQSVFDLTDTFLVFDTDIFDLIVKEPTELNRMTVYLYV